MAEFPYTELAYPFEGPLLSVFVNILDNQILLSITAFH